MNLKNTKWMGIIILLSLLMTGISFGERGYDLDELDDLELESLDRQKKKTTQRDDKGQRLILFDDNLYLLDDEFDFGNDEIELQKLELNPDDMETAKEYEDFLNAFFDNSIPVGNNQYGGQKNLRAERNLIQVQGVLNQNTALQAVKIQGHHHFKHLLGNLDLEFQLCLGFQYLWGKTKD